MSIYWPQEIQGEIWGESSIEFSLGDNWEESREAVRQEPRSRETRAAKPWDNNAMSQQSRETTEPQEARK